MPTTCDCALQRIERTISRANVVTLYNVAMGRILFLSAMAFVAYKYIATSNKRHDAVGPAPNPKAIPLPPATTPVLGELRSPAAEPDPIR